MGKFMAMTSVRTEGKINRSLEGSRNLAKWTRFLNRDFWTFLRCRFSGPLHGRRWSLSAANRLATVAEDSKSRANPSTAVSAAMGMCAVKGPRVLGEDEHVDHDDGELSPRSTISTTSSGSSGYGSASSHELDEAEASDRFSFSDGALWQRTIPKGRRCKPLSFSGMIVYDANGRQVANLTLPQVDAEEEEEDDDEYFSSQPRNLAESRSY